jgi:hypothetical protein
VLSKSPTKKSEYGVAFLKAGAKVQLKIEK